MGNALWKYDNGEGLRGIMKDDYDNRLDQLEAKFEKDKEAIENSSLSKDVKKDKVRSLKNQYKQEKERLRMNVMLLSGQEFWRSNFKAITQSRHSG